MKVVFIEDVPSVAEAGEIREVADGYGRNYLIPKRLAVLADARATQIVEAQKKRKAHLETETEEEMRELAKQLEGLDIDIKAKAGAKEKLYGSITNADIAEELNRSTGLEVDKRKIELEKPIHEIGSYEIAIRLTKDIVPKIKLSIIEEEGKEGKEKKGSKAGKEEKKKTTKAEKVVEEAKAAKQEEAVAEVAEAEVKEETEQGV
ncbi:MAG TPA: 50S ribosomal protein L9 [Dehalococcoidia bacterium]|nr:50S ribosomal protein L9 [Dehalococcoidia bacterium]